MNQIARLPLPPETQQAPRRKRGARTGVFGVLDIGTTKTVCLIARIEGDGEPRVLGFGWQRGRGVKSGSIVDLEEAERAIRAAVAQAEEMADTQLTGALVHLSCGQPESRQLNIQWPIGGRAVTEADMRAIVNEGRRRLAEEGREAVHCFPLGFTVDATPGVDDPRGMICEHLGARLHVVDAAQPSLRNLGATLARCEMEVEELISAPFAAGLATLVEDEKQLGATVIDLGGGTTSIAVFGEGHLLHTAQLPVGGWNVTNDIARGLSTPLRDAERLKTLHGSAELSHDDEKEMLTVQVIGEDEGHVVRVPRAMVMNIIRPRLEETFELVRDRLENANLPPEIGRGVVLTGGASQMVGIRELAATVLQRPVRLARPFPIRGLPEMAAGPAFAAPLGLLSWASGVGRPVFDIAPGPSRQHGLFQRIVSWLRERS